MDTIQARRQTVTADVRLRILRAGVTENLCHGTMARARRAAALLPPTGTVLRIVKSPRNPKPLIDIPVQDVNEASAIWCAYRDAKVMAGGNTSNGALIVVDGTERGYVSYNGKVWEGSPLNWKPGATPIYDPSAE